MRTKHNLLILFLLLAASSVCAQNADRVRINEVVPNNQDGYEDDYGQRSPWFELFNSSYNNANIEGCYLSNDINQPKMYMIPKGDKLTKMEKRQHVVFFADGKEERGTFHLNFTLDSTARNSIYLFDANGKTLIDSVCVPVLLADHSWGHPIEGDGTWQVMERVTPKANNRTLDTNEKMDKFSVGDPVGIGMSLTAMGVVFSVLILLAVFFKLFTKSSIYMSARRAIRSKGEKAIVIKAEEMSGEIHAAISLALYELDSDVHDMEDMVLTISRTRRTYSPWSSKIYGLRQMPNRK